MKTSKTETPIFQSACMGACMGATEALVNHPLWTIKTRIQSRLPFSLNPRVLYSGLGVHCVSSMPLDIIQVTVSRIFFEGRLLEHLQQANRRISAGFLGGAISAVVSCPAEMIMTQQQSKESFVEASRLILSSGKVSRFFTALIPTIMREGVFCCGVFAGVPLIEKKCKEAGLSSLASMSIAGVSSGLLATVGSQPFDMVKTIMQSAPLSLPISIRASVHDLYRDFGVRGFFSGMGLRSIRVVSAVFILGNLNNYLEKTFCVKQN